MRAHTVSEVVTWCDRPSAADHIIAVEQAKFRRALKRSLRKVGVRGFDNAAPTSDLLALYDRVFGTAVSRRPGMFNRLLRLLCRLRFVRRIVCRIKWLNKLFK